MITNVQSSGAAAAPQTSTSTRTADAESFDDILADFEKAARETPAEKVRREILEKHHLTEKSYAALPLDQKKQIETEITQAVKQRVAGEQSRLQQGLPG